MLTSIHTKLPMIDKEITHKFYVNKLGFNLASDKDYKAYLMIQKKDLKFTFFSLLIFTLQKIIIKFIEEKNTNELYQQFINQKTEIHPKGSLDIKPWGQKEFSLLDPDNNLLTFGQSID